jgi:hypothetical protein
MSRLIPSLSCLAMLSACAAAVPAPMPLSASGPTEVVVDGASFIADLQPVTDGAQIGVSRPGAALSMDEGILAKKVALAFCDARGQSLDSRALGAFVSGGIWAFDGGCV